MRSKFTTSFLLVACSLSWTCYAAEVLFVDLPSQQSVQKKQIELACRFYGLDIEYLDVAEGKNKLHILQTLKESNALAIVFAARALSYIEPLEALSVLNRKGENSIPILIMGVTPAMDSSILAQWSRGAVVACLNSEISPSGYYRVNESRDIARELAGQNIPFTGNKGYYLLPNESKKYLPLIEVVCQNHKGLPTFLKTTVAGREVFFLTQMQPSNSNKESKWEYTSNRFIEIAPVMIFLRYSFGERCWHSIGDYANLTVDDPWLTEPYGHLTYKGLLEEMLEWNFHTTIAFIPWNFDRSKPEVISLIREHIDRFSICIHGNNHDHYEFYKYETEPGDPWPAKPLDVQEENIKQGIARMEKFRNLTTLSFERVMVFPHGIAPSKTLGLLKKYNFLATINANNVPLGVEEPVDPLVRLSPILTQFENFPSLRRYAPSQRTQTDIAFDLFLDNPILFYDHHDFFKTGINAFKKTVEVVNTIQPKLVWQSLGYISQHLYLEKLRDDGDYDILTFSSNIILENTHQSEATFYVQKEESFKPPIKQLTVDGEINPYEKTERGLMTQISIPAGESRHIVIEYENDLDLASIDVSKNDLRVNLLRRMSDFRDITLSSNALGRSLTHLYYETDLYKWGLKNLAIVTFAMAALIVSAVWYFRRHFHNR